MGSDGAHVSAGARRLLDSTQHVGEFTEVEERFEWDLLPNVNVKGGATCA